MLNRICTNEYAVPNSTLKIPLGTPIVISLLGLARDERYFPQPERFWPERFTENDRNFDENAFMPFGEGPRKCIGMLTSRKKNIQITINNFFYIDRITFGQNYSQSWIGSAVAIVRFPVYSERRNRIPEFFGVFNSQRWCRNSSGRAA